MDDDRRSNVAGEVSGTEASPATEPREMTDRERDLAAKTLRDRDAHNVPPETQRGTSDDQPADDVDRRP